MGRLIRIGIIACVFLAVSTRDSHGYSVLSHEASIDALWDDHVVPLLRKRFPRASSADLEAARAYAYGGSVIQDLGYYPFGSHFFSNLLHYVRSGDFVETLLRDARDVDEYAFAVGALAHYAADNVGHAEAVNVAVPMVYPKLEEKFGDRVSYEDSPKSHVLVEFSFDVVQVAAGAYAPARYHNFVGFKVSKPLLERAFKEVYGLDLRDVFVDEDLAIGTYRWAIGQAIPNMTKIAWRDKREEIERLTPGIARQKFVFSVSRRDFEQEFGPKYRRPGILVRVMSFIYGLMPRIGPFKYLSFRPPTPEAEALFLRSFTDARARLRRSLDALRDGTLDLPNTNFDTGLATVRGRYALADRTYAELRDKLQRRKFAGASPSLRADLARFFGTDRY